MASKKVPKLLRENPLKKLKPRRGPRKKPPSAGGPKGIGSSIRYRKLREAGKRLYAASEYNLDEIAVMLSVGLTTVSKWSRQDGWREERANRKADHAQRYAVEIEEEHEKKLRESLDGVGQGADYLFRYLKAYRVKFPLIVVGAGGTPEIGDLPRPDDMERLTRILEKLKQVTSELYGGVAQHRLSDPMEMLRSMSDDELRQLIRQADST